MGFMLPELCYLDMCSLEFCSLQIRSSHLKYLKNSDNLFDKKYVHIKFPWKDMFNCVQLCGKTDKGVNMVWSSKNWLGVKFKIYRYTHMGIFL
jgi:hypothetical protein